MSYPPEFWHWSEVKRLEEFRQILVERRREIVEQIFSMKAKSRDSSPSLGSRSGPLLQVIQEQIEAVDRALMDEKALSDPRHSRKK
jgi:hypothetical protein